MLMDLTVRLGAVLLAAWLGARWLAEPLRRLAQAAQAMASDIGSPPLPATGTRECRQAAELINRLQAHVQAQLAQRDLFVAAVSHDLRTPLTRLALRAEALPQGRDRERFGRDIAEMDTMIRGTLDHLCGQADAETVRRLDLRALLQSLAEDAQETGQPVSLDSGDPALALLVPAQHSALRRCIANLVENAVRYGGRAHIELRRLDAGRARVSVSDDGPGIPEALLPQVTLPFFRVDASRHRHHGGVGLGLAVADEVARRHGGHLRLANRPEGGLRADLDLPLAP
jgi:protein-histidine pros-kinase